MKKYILAVSGGVDSVALLDMASNWPNAELVVAHFDHGMRPDSPRDAAFVRQLAEKYHLPFETERVELGEQASEERARHARYDFLKRVAKKYGAQIVTAHHADDVLETILINIRRGTGWRGLCSLRSGKVLRPLLGKTKDELLAYAHEHQLAWREDTTNQDIRYTRNYVRHVLLPQLSDAKKTRLLTLYKKQISLLAAIERETTRLLSEQSVGPNEYPRYLFIMADPAPAAELLYAAIFKATGQSAMRPQLKRALMAVKTFQAGTSFAIGQGIWLRFSRANVIVEVAGN